MRTVTVKGHVILAEGEDITIVTEDGRELFIMLEDGLLTINDESGDAGTIELKPDKWEPFQDLMPEKK